MPPSSPTPKSRRFRLGLRGQLLLVFGLVFGLATLAAGSYQYRSLGRLLARADDDRLRLRASQLLSRVSLDPEPTLPLPDQTGETMRLVFEEPGQPPRELFRSARWPVGDTGGLPRPVAPGHELKHGRVVAVARLAAPPGPGADNAEPTGRLTLWLAHPAAPLEKALARVRRTLALGLLGSAGLAGALALLVAGVVLRPLRRMAAQARRIQQAQDIAPLPVPDTGDEVQELAETLNQLLARLRGQATAQANFLAAAAHELRTPLATLQTGLDVSGRDPSLPPATRAALAGHDAELARLGRLVDDFLLVGRLGNGTDLPVSKQPVALDELLLALADRELPRFRAAGRTLTIDLPDDAPTAALTAETDTDQLITLLLNLLDNARKHARPGTGVALRLQAAEAGRGPVINIENELAAPLGEHLAQLTTAWYQADPLAPGTGLGLWIAGRLALGLGLQLTFQEQQKRLVVAVGFPA
ncbi:HAMP domain-containing protein [Microvirga sp. STS02]|uniref:histidine kinase dimerization/phospho-acceptor domain-containing protein n=1 Tax=Hymenobacter negativus TaxID=2795026 RepID=UPI0018DEACEF|nr:MULTISPECIES: histidine kinase dimerization/phospho-acceptor domain-containing protein [Bacteria]MBH8568248.1 HAMP domain-containing protein [Hymenobacter negativus]MBR7207983.1 HAMP domain-containing protein [Microvirga sp. STS02]